MQLIGRPNPRNAARAFIQKNDIEFISMHDLKTYLDKLDAAARAYIDGTQEGYHRVYFDKTTKAENAAWLLDKSIFFSLCFAKYRHLHMDYYSGFNIDF